MTTPHRYFVGLFRVKPTAFRHTAVSDLMVKAELFKVVDSFRKAMTYVKLYGGDPLKRITYPTHPDCFYFRCRRPTFHIVVAIIPDE